jgi:hypothetical protein
MEVRAVVGAPRSRLGALDIRARRASYCSLCCWRQLNGDDRTVNHQT